MDVRKVLWIANLGLVGLLGYMVVDIVVRPAGADQPQAFVAPVSQVAATEPFESSPSTEQDYNVILNRNVFGVEVGNPVSSAESESSLSSASPNLKLLGTIAGDPDVSRALIADLNANYTDVYRMGDTVQGARVEKIERGKVYLMVGAREEVLEMIIQPASATSVSSQVVQAPSPPPDFGPPGPERLFFARRGPYSRLGGVAAVLRMGRLEPFVVGRGRVGLRVNEIDEGLSRFSGLQTGDIIMAINNQDVAGSIERARDIMQEAMREGRMEIKVIRNDREELISYANR